MHSTGHILAAALLCERLPRLTQGLKNKSILQYIKDLQKEEVKGKTFLGIIERTFNVQRDTFPKELLADRMKKILKRFKNIDLSGKEISALTRNILKPRGIKAARKISVEIYNSTEDIRNDPYTFSNDFMDVEDVLSWYADADEIVLSDDDISNLLKEIKRIPGLNNLEAVTSLATALAANTFDQLISNVAEQKETICSVISDLEAIIGDNANIRFLISGEINEGETLRDDDSLNSITEEDILRKKNRIEKLISILTNLCDPDIVELNENAVSDCLTDLEKVGDSLFYNEFPLQLKEKGVLHLVEYLIKKRLRHANCIIYYPRKSLYARRLRLNDIRYLATLKDYKLKSSRQSNKVALTSNEFKSEYITITENEIIQADIQIAQIYNAYYDSHKTTSFDVDDVGGIYTIRFSPHLTDSNQQSIDFAESKRKYIKRRLLDNYSYDHFTLLERAILLNQSWNNLSDSQRKIITDIVKSITPETKYRTSDFYELTWHEMQNSLNIIKALRRGIVINETDVNINTEKYIDDNDNKKTAYLNSIRSTDNAIVSTSDLKNYTAHIVFNETIEQYAKKGLEDQITRSNKEIGKNIPLTVSTLIHGSIDPDIYKHGGTWNKQHHSKTVTSNNQRGLLKFRERFAKFYSRAVYHAENGRTEHALYNYCALTHYFLDSIIFSNNYNHEYVTNKVRNIIFGMEHHPYIINDVLSAYLQQWTKRDLHEYGDQSLENDTKTLANNPLDLKYSSTPAEDIIYNINNLIGNYQFYKLAAEYTNVNSDVPEFVKKAFDLLFSLGANIEMCLYDYDNKVIYGQAIEPGKFLSIRRIFGWVSNFFKKDNSIPDTTSDFYTKPLWTLESTCPFGIDLQCSRIGIVGNGDYDFQHIRNEITNIIKETEDIDFELSEVDKNQSIIDRLNNQCDECNNIIMKLDEYDQQKRLMEILGVARHNLINANDQNEHCRIAKKQFSHTNSLKYDN